MASTRGRKMQTFQALVADLNVSVYISYLRNLSPNFQFKQLLYDIGKRLPIFLVVGHLFGLSIAKKQIKYHILVSQRAVNLILKVKDIFRPSRTPIECIKSPDSLKYGFKSRRNQIPVPLPAVI